MSLSSPSLKFARQQRDKCAAYVGPDPWGAFLGWADWSVEIKLLEAMTTEALVTAENATDGAAR